MAAIWALEKMDKRGDFGLIDKEPGRFTTSALIRPIFKTRYFRPLCMFVALLSLTTGSNSTTLRIFQRSSASCYPVEIVVPEKNMAAP
jgi:hypothetical protein